MILHVDTIQQTVRYAYHKEPPEPDTVIPYRPDSLMAVLIAAIVRVLADEALTTEGTR